MARNEHPSSISDIKIRITKKDCCIDDFSKGSITITHNEYVGEVHIERSNSIIKDTLVALIKLVPLLKVVIATIWTKT